MHFKLINIFLAINLFLSLSTWDADPGFWDEKVEIIDAYEAESGYYLYIPKADLSNEVVVFLHGYGGLNPMIYGGWIKHLLEQGHIVVYPRYQENIYSPRPREFARNSAIAIKEAMAQLAERKVVIPDQLNYVGHSYGGAISAFIGIHYDSLGLEKPKSLMLCQPGTGPLKGLRLDNYEHMDSTIPFVVVVGENDLTVGEILGKAIYQTTTKSQQKLFVRHYADKSVDPPITATHYEPYALDEELDNQILNYTAKRALEKGKIDEVDALYWDLLDQLIDQPASLFESDNKLPYQSASN